MGLDVYPLHTVELFCPVSGKLLYTVHMLTTSVISFTRISLGIFIGKYRTRSEEHTSELQSRGHLVCRLLLEKKKETYQGRPEPRTSNTAEHMTLCPSVVPYRA